MKVINKLNSAAVKYPASIFGLTGSLGTEAIGISYLYTSIPQKNLYDFILGGGLVSLGLIIGNISKKIWKEERELYERISREVESKGFTKRHIRHIDKELLKVISQEKNLLSEYREAEKKYAYH